MGVVVLMLSIYARSTPTTLPVPVLRTFCGICVGDCPGATQPFCLWAFSGSEIPYTRDCAGCYALSHLDLRLI